MFLFSLCLQDVERKCNIRANYKPVRFAMAAHASCASTAVHVVSASSTDANVLGTGVSRSVIPRNVSADDSIVSASGIFFLSVEGGCWRWRQWSRV
jgi:hypothetical protein